MGLFGTKKDPAADQLADAASQPGAIPVATPVLPAAEETTYSFQQQNPTANTVPIKATLVTAPQPPPAAVQSSQQSNNNRMEED
eukprot:CAMPEP_0113518002 /NCGR_PEP_ID=MMETSP0014_2-20120614/42599_1 /TAXON_ID=2857 /ORGANISM="Nitzschia sp." /LENGTH=83 /DNA_ID=CAMNT_0000415315 /DNA_START=119 /DNA_END=371 /DNA_ORIENTATION=+ /assembly_acc=CAM_ASM_000159